MLSAMHILRLAVGRDPRYHDAAVSVLSELPDEAEAPLVELAGDFAAMCIDSPRFDYITALDNLPTPVVARAVASAHLSERVVGQFVRAMTPAGWRRALEVIRTLHRRPAKAPSLRRAVAEIAADASIVAAIATAVENASVLDHVSFGAVLVVAQTPEAMRALERHLPSPDYDFDVVLGFADTPAILALRDRRARALVDVREASPGIRLLRALGLTGDSLRVVASFEAPEHDTAIGVHLETPNKYNHRGVFTVRCHQDSIKTSFDESRLHRDELGIGRCDVLELPTWVASVGDRLGMRWTLRIAKLTPAGPTRTAVQRWLGK